MTSRFRGFRAVSNSHSIDQMITSSIKPTSISNFNRSISRTIRQSINISLHRHQHTAAQPADSTHSTSHSSINQRRDDLKPSLLVKELDRYIIGQSDAKKCVAVALRNRWRRHRLPADMRAEVMPKNMLMIGPTGSGKTEIARRLAKLTDSPFVKVEATKFTEVGFHGRDVDSIIQDLVRVSINQLKSKKRRELKDVVTANVENRILDALVGPGGSRVDLLHLLRNRALDNQEIEVELPVKSESVTTASNEHQRVLEQALGAFSSSGKGRKERRRLLISDARPLLEEAEYDTHTVGSDVTAEAVRAVESDGIVFLDEIDKICSPASSHKYADASAEGVQRDLLPLIEGTTVSTKQGDVNTTHILFICSGAFHAVKPSDLMAELQGRLPIRVELKQLTENELYQILTQTENNLIQQQQALLAVDGCKLTFTEDALREIARTAATVNSTVENIGARRLHTIVEKLCDEPSYQAADGIAKDVVIDKQTVQTKLKEMTQTADLYKFLL